MSEWGQVRRPATRSSPEVARRLRAPVRHGAEPRRVALATATLILIMAALVAMTIVRSQLAAQVRSPLSHKLADAERIAYYMVEPEAGPVFRIAPHDRSLKLITHLLLPASTPYDPEAEYAYGIVVIVRSLDGEEQWRHELNIRTRQSKSGGVRFGWRYENAFLLGDDRQLTDDRLTRVRLPEAETDRLVELRLIPQVPLDDVSGLARVYVRRPRPVDDRALRELAFDPEEARALVDNLTYRDWDQLSEDERRVKLSQVWERLAAEGEPGRDYETLSIYETGFRLPRGATTNARRLEVDRWRSLAVNVIGPAEIELEAFEGEGTAASLEITRIGLDGVGFGYPRLASRVRSLDVPAGVHTIYFESERRIDIELRVVDAEAERVWLIEAERSIRQDEHGHEVLEPDRRQIEIVRVGPQWPINPRWSVADVEDATARIFRFDVRVVAHVSSAWWRGRGPTPELDVCYIDGEGQDIGCDRWTGYPSIGSRFEGLRDGSEGEARRERWYVSSEPQTLRVNAPRGAVAVELRDPRRAAADGPDQRLIVRGYGFWPEVDTTLAEPFRLYESELMRWRYPPLDTRTWFPLRPDNYDALEDSVAITELLAQVRLQPDGEGDAQGDGRGWPWSSDYDDPDFDDGRQSELDGADGWDPGPWVTLEPRGIHRRRLVLELLDDDAAKRLVTRWDSSLFTEIWPSRTMVTDFSATGPGAPELHWQVDPRTLGRSVSLTIDGQQYEHQLAATRGRWRLPVTGGRRRIAVELDAPRRDWEMWIDRPVLIGSPPVSRRRAIHELTTELVFPLTKPGPEALTVNVVVYLPRRREQAELVLSVDDGQPERRTGVVGDRVSVAERRFIIDASEAFEPGDDGEVSPGERRIPRVATKVVEVDAQPGLPLDVVTLQLTLGEDVVAGPHELRVKLRDGGRVWVRAFRRGVPDRSKPAASWTEPVREAP